MQTNATTTLIDDLESALASGDATQRIKTLERVTDLFVSGAPGFSPEQIGVFDDIFLRISERIEATALARLSRLLAPVRQAPPQVTRALAFNDDIVIAAPILSRSESLSDADLQSLAASMGPEHMLAISHRVTLNVSVTDILIERGNRTVVNSIAANRGARFSYAGLRTLVNRSANDDELALNIGLRPDLPVHHMVMLTERASAAVREKLVKANPAAAIVVQEVLANVVNGLRSQLRDASVKYREALAKVAELQRAGQLTEAALYGFARERKFEETAATLALMCRVPIDVVERALVDHGAEGVLILGKVAGLSWTSVKAVLLIQAANRGISAQDLETAMNSYTRLQENSARRVLGFYHARYGPSKKSESRADVAAG